MNVQTVASQTNSSVASPPQNGAPVNNQEPGAIASSDGQAGSPSQVAHTKLDNPAVYQISLSLNGRNADSSVKRNASPTARKRAAANQGSGTASPPLPQESNTVVFKKTDNNQLVMQVIDKKTDKVLKQYPPEETQRIGRALDKFLASQQPANTNTINGLA